MILARLAMGRRWPACLANRTRSVARSMRIAPRARMCGTAGRATVCGPGGADDAGAVSRACPWVEACGAWAKTMAAIAEATTATETITAVVRSFTVAAPAAAAGGAPSNGSRPG